MMTNKKYNMGVIHGRFQVLHNDHLKYLLAGKALCEHLVVGITNPDPTHTKEDAADPGRSERAANPLSYYERYTMLRAALNEAGQGGDSYSIVPLPINMPELYKEYVPLDAVFFLTIYDDWGRKKQAQFQSMGLNTHVLWEKYPENKGINATHVREAIARGEAWEKFVPASVAKLVTAWNLARRLELLMSNT